MEAITLSGLSKSFGKGTKAVHALQSVDLTVDQGEIFSLLGPNGAGKTTLIKCVLGIVFINGGSGTVLGAALGALLLNTINSALVVVNVSSFWSQALAGGLLVAAIAFDRLVAVRVAPALRTRRSARG